MIRLAGLLLLLSIAAHGQDAVPVIAVANPPNSAAAQAAHYVVMVSLDGFRYDYPKKYGAPHLLALGAEGASAPDGMLPSYPSLTFPNHLSLITGLYPEHHGIVANSFYDPARDATYVYTKSEKNGDGTWYGGTPLWVLAEQQGMRSACLFWPGSEAEIGGKRPSYYLKFNDKLDDERRIDQVVAWLKLPPEQRPHFITLYFANVDHAGHSYGPESDEVRAAVHHLDDMVGELHAKLDALKLPLDLMVVADHGMVTLKPERVTLADYADLTNFHTEGSLLYAKTEAETAKAYAEFQAHPDPRFRVYRRKDVPAALHYDANPREGDPVIVPNGPYEIRAHAPARPDTLVGGHGFDPRAIPEMKAIFFAAGPDVRKGVALPVFENVNVYPFVAGMLGLKTPEIDGDVKSLQSALVRINIQTSWFIEPAMCRAFGPLPLALPRTWAFGPGLYGSRLWRLARRTHLRDGFLDGCFGNTVGDQSAAQLFNRAVSRPFGFTLGKVFAEALRDVGADEGLVASEAEGGSGLLRVVDHIIGQPQGDQRHGFVGLHIAPNPFRHLHSVLLINTSPSSGRSCPPRRGCLRSGW